MTATAPANRPFSASHLAKTVAGGILGIAFGLALGAAVVAILATQFFGFKLVTVSSNSMEPALSVGDLVVIRPASQTDIAEGDIIFFRQGVDAIPTLHRVIGANTMNTVLRNADGTETMNSAKLFTTKGDNNSRPDSGDVGPDELQGELWFTVPILSGSGGPSLQLVLVGIAAILGAGWMSYEIYNRIGKRESASPTGGGEA